MEEVLQDLSGPSVAAALEANVAALFPFLFRRWPRAEVHDDPAMLWSLTDVPFPLFNGVLRARLSPDDVEDAIEAAVSRARSRNVPLLWWTGPTTQPADLGPLLTGHGFSHSAEMPGMAADLTALPEYPPLPPGLAIERVTDGGSMEDWCGALCAGFGMPTFVRAAFVDLSQTLSLEAQSPYRCYLGRLHGKTVATSSLFLAAGVGGIYNVTTLPDARRSGIGAAMTRVPMQEARALRYRVGVLFSSEMGASVYRRLGFQEYCRIGQYVWRPG